MKMKRKLYPPGTLITATPAWTGGPKPKQFIALEWLVIEIYPNSNLERPQNCKVLDIEKQVVLEYTFSSGYHPSVTYKYAKPENQP